MLIMRITVALGMGVLAPVLLTSQSANRTCQNDGLAGRYPKETLTVSRPQEEHYFARFRGPLASSLAATEVNVAEDSAGTEDQARQQTDPLPQNPVPQGTQPVNSVDTPLPDAASATRAGSGPTSAREGGRERVAVAVYPIKFPYTPRQKLGLFVRDIYDPFNFIGEGFNALLEQSEGTPRAYGGGATGYGKRLGAIVGTDIVGEFTGTFLFPSIFRTDPRYFRMARGSLPRRFFYALSRQLIVKSDSGDDTFNASKFLSGIASTTVSNSYYPNRDRSFPGIVKHTLINMGFDALNDSFREFWPDIAHGLHIPAFVIRRTADPAFIDPMDTPPMSTPKPATPESTQPQANPASPTSDHPRTGLPENLQVPQ